MRGSQSLSGLVLVSLAAAGCTGTLEVQNIDLPNGAVGKSYTYTCTDGGDSSVTWELSSGELPTGLALDSASGELSGIPYEAGTFQFTITARGDGWSGSQSFRATLVIIEKLSAGGDVPPARLAEKYDYQFSVTGGVPPYAYALIGLPGGLAFDDRTATITGTPLVAKDGIQLQFTVTDSGTPRQTVVKSIDFEVKPLAVEITTGSLPNGRVNTVYSEQLAAVQGKTSYTWAVTAGVLPDGLKLNRTTGVIAGTPTVAQTKTFTVTVTDSDTPASSDSAEFTVTIIGPLAITTTSLPAGKTQQAYTAALAAADGVPPYAWQITQGTLPDGLELDNVTGAVSGTPTAGGSWEFTVQVTDNDTPRSTKTAQLSIEVTD